MPIKIDLIDAQKTKQLGASLAKTLKQSPLNIFVRGELGAGKTTLVQGFISEMLEKPCAVLSPTYAYMHTYEHAPLVYHFDLYRIETPSQLFELGLFDFISDDRTMRLIEWPERLDTFAISPDLDIELIKISSRRQALITPAQNFPYSLTHLLMGARST